MFFFVDVYVYPVVYIIVLFLCCLFLLRFIWARSTKFRMTTFKKSIRDSLHFSVPLIIGVLSAIGLNAADRFIVNYYHSETDVANYTVAYTAAMIFMAFLV